MKVKGIIESELLQDTRLMNTHQFSLEITVEAIDASFGMPPHSIKAKHKKNWPWPRFCIENDKGEHFIKSEHEYTNYNWMT